MMTTSSILLFFEGRCKRLSTGLEKVPVEEENNFGAEKIPRVKKEEGCPCEKKTMAVKGSENNQRVWRDRNEHDFGNSLSRSCFPGRTT